MEGSSGMGTLLSALPPSPAPTDAQLLDRRYLGDLGGTYLPTGWEQGGREKRLRAIKTRSASLRDR